ncbi:MAG: hypothetical protein H0U49_01455 [Parachlamydiaceae bacterium]|nr:hypothetical protein [Parachlamydiaceae bacterium]
MQTLRSAGKIIPFQTVGNFHSSNVKSTENESMKEKSKEYSKLTSMIDSGVFSIFTALSKDFRNQYPKDKIFNDPIMRRRFSECRKENMPNWLFAVFLISVLNLAYLIGGKKTDKENPSKNLSSPQ